MPGIEVLSSWTVIVNTELINRIGHNFRKTLHHSQSALSLSLFWVQEPPLYRITISIYTHLNFPVITSLILH